MAFDDDDMEHYMRMIASIEATIDLMQEMDDTITDVGNLWQ